MNKQTIIDYVCNTPENSNPAVLATLLDEFTESPGGYEETLLWENPNPGAAMPSLTIISGITKDTLKNYNYIKFEHSVDASGEIGGTIVETKFLLKDENIGFAYCIGFLSAFSRTSNPYYRTFAINDRGEFYTYTTNSFGAIPLKIYGVNFN